MKNELIHNNNNNNYKSSSNNCKNQKMIYKKRNKKLHIRKRIQQNSIQINKTMKLINRVITILIIITSVVVVKDWNEKAPRHQIQKHA